jgi:YbgC/YbaW family acyl-CoA thioester hydrolase
LNQTFTHPVQARFQDIDAAGILFFGRNFDYFHDAYVAFLEAVGLPLPNQLKAAEIVLPLVHAQADFVAPVPFGTRADIELHIKRIGDTSFTVAYTMRRNDGVVLTRGKTVHCAVTTNGFKGCPLPEPLRRALEDYAHPA